MSVKKMQEKLMQMKKGDEAKITNKAKLKKALLEAKKEHPINSYVYNLDFEQVEAVFKLEKIPRDYVSTGKRLEKFMRQKLIREFLTNYDKPLSVLKSKLESLPRPVDESPASSDSEMEMTV